MPNLLLFDDSLTLIYFQLRMNASLLGAPDGVSRDAEKYLFLSAEFGIGYTILQDTRFKLSKRHLGCGIGPKNSCGMREMTLFSHGI